MQAINPGIDSFGTKTWRDEEGNLHREDGPAVEYLNGTKYWFKHGKCHRENGPAIEHPNGAKEWCYEGKLHREDGPAIECPSGAKMWVLKDKKLPPYVQNVEQLKSYIRSKVLW